MSHSIFPAQHVMVAPQRRLAYSEVGSAQSACVLICLPGLLETRATFDPLLQAAQELQGVRVISVDHCGRGDSDDLTDARDYVMSRYLNDATTLMTQLCASPSVTDIVLLGTSMGGILSLYLAREWGDRVKGLMLNDVGLSLNWLSLYGLYGQMRKSGALKDLQTLARQLNVREAVIQAVQMPAHFDLAYKKDWRGMHFAALVKGFRGCMRLVRGIDSSICLAAQAQELMHLLPQTQVLAVPGAAHPVPFDAAVNAFLLNGLGQTPDMKQRPGAMVMADTAAEPAQAPWGRWQRWRQGMKRWWTI